MEELAKEEKKSSSEPKQTGSDKLNDNFPSDDRILFKWNHPTNSSEIIFPKLNDNAKSNASIMEMDCEYTFESEYQVLTEPQLKSALSAGFGLVMEEKYPTVSRVLVHMKESGTGISTAGVYLFDTESFMPISDDLEVPLVCGKGFSEEIVEEYTSDIDEYSSTTPPYSSSSTNSGAGSTEVVDVTAPILSWKTKPLGIDTIDNPTIEVRSNEDINEYICKLDEVNQACSIVGANVIKLDGLSLDDGDYTVKFKASDDSGNWSSWINYDFEVDTTAPTPSFTTAYNSRIAYNSTETASAYFAITYDTSVDSFAYRYRRVGLTGSWVSVTGNSFTLPLEVGTHTIYIKTKDLLDNESDIVSHTIDILPRFYVQTFGSDQVVRDRGNGITAGSSIWLTAIFSPLNYSDALNGCSNLTYAGYSDWVLADTSELEDWTGDYLTKYQPAFASKAYWTKEVSANYTYLYSSGAAVSSPRSGSQLLTQYHVVCMR